MTLNDLIAKYKQHEVDFILPDPEGDVPVYLDLYLLYESPEERWHKVQALLYTHFNHYLKKHREGTITEEALISALYFPEVSLIAFGHCKTGTEGRGTARERAELIKRFIFDDTDVQVVGMDAIAKMSVEIENVGPDVLSDMVANFAMHYLIDYTREQVEIYGLKTAEQQIPRVLNTSPFGWRALPKIQLPYFIDPKTEDAEPRVLVPRHLVRKLPILSARGFFKNFLRFVLKAEKEDRVAMLRTIGKKPKVFFKDVEKDLVTRYGSVAAAAKSLVRDRPELIKDYVKNPHLYEKLARKRKRNEGIDWRAYKEELTKIAGGKEHARTYAEYLRKVFTALYSGNLMNGKLEEKSEDDLFFYDITFTNAADTPFFRALKNQQIKAGVLILEAKNYEKTDMGNDEFNQSRAYTITGGRELVFLATRRNITDRDITRARRHFLSAKVVVLPLSDADVFALIDARNGDPERFDVLLVERLQKILSA